MEFLDKINSPSDLKNLNIEELKRLAKELRQVILDTVMDTGGHLASSLGVVEIIIAMHYVMDAPQDKLIFDVGHQSYAHKLLTGRYKQFDTLRKKGGLSGFPKRSESQYDVLDTGHSSTSISAACGITRAMKHYNDNHTVVSLIGDGALTGGMVYEALNDVAEINKKQIIILNDNSMSISGNVGSTAQYLLRLHGSKSYQRAKSIALRIVNSVNMDKNNLTIKLLYSAKNSLKYFIQGGMPFEQFGLKYFGPIDGHNIEYLIKALTEATNSKESVIIHAITVKGKGYLKAEQNPKKYHGYGKGCEEGKSFSTAFGEGMVEIATKDDKVYAITAAMSDGVGLSVYEELFDKRFVDVGIAEQHAMTMSAGLALSNLKPYFAVYSSFLQRATDQLIHDVCLQDLAVTVCIDRAGIIGGDGETHQGIYDVAIMRCIPNLCIMSPRNNTELIKMLHWSLEYNHPLAIRYSKGSYGEEECTDIEFGKWERLTEGKDIVILACGAAMVSNAMVAYQKLLGQNVEVEVVNARFIKPLDREYLAKLKNRIVITLEDNLLAGGFGSAVAEQMLFDNIKVELHLFGINSDSLQHATVSELQKLCGIDVETIVKRILEIIKAKTL